MVGLVNIQNQRDCQILVVCQTLRYFAKNITMPSITFQPLKRLSPAEFLDFSLLNQGLICEMNANGSIILKTFKAKKYNQIAEKLRETLNDWNNIHEEGVVFDMRIGYVLPNGAILHPTLSWIKAYKLNTQKEHLIEAVPDFFVEFLTESDTVQAMKMRMKTYMLNGALLGWLIDKDNEKVYIFKNDGTEEEVEYLKKSISGGVILRGYEFAF